MSPEESEEEEETSDSDEEQLRQKFLKVWIRWIEGITEKSATEQRRSWRKEKLGRPSYGKHQKIYLPGW
jgi:hypothetical protein